MEIRKTTYAISKDYGAIELTSMIQNVNSHRFYENNGFEKNISLKSI